MPKQKCDFSGWATKANLLCSDGRVIGTDAFAGNDGKVVPLIWGHQHNDPTRVLGHALLENRGDGVYAYGTFNNTEAGKTAKTLVEHGDVEALSIFATQLKHNKNNVVHGNIIEVSLVLAGANPGASIDDVVMAHGEDGESEGYIYTGEPLNLSHSEENPEEKGEPEKDKSKEKEDSEGTTEPDDKAAELEHAEKTDGEKTIAQVLDTFNEEQKTAFYAVLGQVLEEAGDTAKTEEENEESKGGNTTMKHNVFDQETEKEQGTVLSHDQLETIIGDAKRYGSLKDSFLAHSAEYGIDSIDYLFPDAKNLNNPPEFISRKMGWVQKVMGATHHTPFSRIKSMFADITEDDARAKGYIKGNLKKEEVFSLLKRTTTPTTIYKKQKLDRDDIVDITDFDVVAWLKSEMRVMLDEEIARSILIGDGRLSSSDDKINEDNIRPIWKDAALYTIKKKVDFSSSDTNDQKAKKFIQAVVRSRKDYKGSGNPVLFTTEDRLTDCLLMEDTQGHVIYDTVEKLTTALRVSEIITVEVMENQTRTGVQDIDGDTDTRTLEGIIVNLNDYNVGADKGGAINMFDDFDIDYNQQKYLIETRCSGALIKPYSAIAIESVTAAAQG